MIAVFLRVMGRPPDLGVMRTDAVYGFCVFHAREWTNRGLAWLQRKGQRWVRRVDVRARAYAATISHCYEEFYCGVHHSL